MTRKKCTWTVRTFLSGNKMWLFLFSSLDGDTSAVPSQEAKSFWKSNHLRKYSPKELKAWLTSNTTAALFTLEHRYEWYIICLICRIYYHYWPNEFNLSFKIDTQAELVTIYPWLNSRWQPINILQHNVLSWSGPDLFNIVSDLIKKEK